MPSLHCAFALFVVVFCFKWVKNWWLRALMLLYPLMMVTALMYFGEHYFADGLAGFAVVGLSFLLWNRIERYWDRRRANAAPVDSEQTDSEQTGSEQAGVRPTVDV